MRRPTTVAVLGAGASGTLTALSLLEQAGSAGRAVRVVLVDPSASTGRGVAYRTSDPAHLLNVPAGRMGADPAAPDGFLAWVRRALQPQAGGGDFLPRSWYGCYLDEALTDAAGRGAASGDGVLVRVHARAIGVDCSRERRGAVVQLEAGSRPGTLAVDAVVLAPGNAAPGVRWAPSALRASPAFVTDPWAQRALPSLEARISRCHPSLPVLLVGSGLTMADLAITLGRAGRQLITVSRSGLLPAAHRTVPISPCAPPALPKTSLTADELRAWFTRHVEETQVGLGDWRPAVDGLRPVTAALWQRMPLPERARFLSLDSRRWEQLRHRMPPAVAAALRELIAAGTLQVRRGSVHSATETASGLRVRLSADPADAVDVAAVVNCTGPETDPYAWDNPLIDDLLAGGLASSDPLGMGLRVDTAGRLIGADGRRSRRLLTIGAPRRGALYESTAIPEIRCQARELAQLLTTGRSQDQPAPSRSSSRSRTALASA